MDRDRRARQVLLVRRHPVAPQLDNLTLVRFALDSVTVHDGNIGFVPSASTYRFEGRATGRR